METSWNLKLFAGIRSFAPLRCWNGLKIRNIEHHDLCRCPSLSDTVLVLHKCKKHTEKQWLPPAGPPGVDCACLYCVAGSLGMWESVCIGLGAGGHPL